MPNPSRKLAFVTAATDHGTFIVNRFDQMIVNGNEGYGVGLQLLEKAHYDPDEVNLLLRALDLRRQCYIAFSANTTFGYSANSADRSGAKADVPISSCA